MYKGILRASRSHRVAAKSTLAIMSLQTEHSVIYRGKRIKNGIWNDSSYVNSLSIPPVLTEKEPLVGSVDDNGVLCKFILIKVVKKTADTFINPWDDS